MQSPNHAFATCNTGFAIVEDEKPAHGSSATKEGLMPSTDKAGPSESGKVIVNDQHPSPDLRLADSIIGSP
jgi:hypothetical protein